ncbi:hypothetical protein Gorai_002007 [Gossypium raimondii]|uniref:Uncharacterized protein n=1 Tax=Gossypium raimondii TaxID=29730 RepID=A0A7J8QQB4_GOSRA|nr:hypothetical protein [Gossypium raimondii]
MDELLQNHLFATHAIAASGSVVFGTALTYPLDTIKSLIQVGSGSAKQLNASQVIKRVRAFSGYSDGREDNFVYVSEALMAGMAAGAVESLTGTPFELIKLRAQVTSASRITTASSASENKAVMPAVSKLLRGYTPDMKALNNAVGMLSILNSKHSNMVSAIQEYPWMMTGSGRPPPVYDVRRPSEIISLEGWGALWRGLRSGVARDSVFGGIFFSTWELLHQVMLNWKAAGMDPPPRYDEEICPLSPLAVSLAAGFSGSVAAAASHGFDTAKSRSQCIVLPKFVSMERKLLKWKTPGKRFEKLTGIHPADRNILFRGIWLRMARSGIASFAIVGSYYFSITHLVSSN